MRPCSHVMIIIDKRKAEKYTQQKQKEARGHCSSYTPEQKRQSTRRSQLAKQDKIDTVNQKHVCNMKPVKQMTPIYDPLQLGYHAAENGRPREGDGENVR